MPANYLESNLKRIEQWDEELADLLRRSYRPEYPEIRSSKDGSPIPVVERKCLHSTYDPVGEADKWAKAQDLKRNDSAFYVLGGLGFAYLIPELLKIIPPDHLIIVERDAALAASAFAHRPPDVFPRGLRFIVGEEPVQAYQMIRRMSASPAQKVVFLEHPASSHVYPDYYPTLKGMIRAQDVAGRGGFKILLVSPLYGGSLPVAHYVHSALNVMGHRCELLDNSVFHPGLGHLQRLTSNRNHQDQLQAMLTNLVAESVTARALEIRADLVLALAQAPVTSEVLEELKKAGIRTAFWFVEDAQTLGYWKAIAPYYDHFFVIQKGDFFPQLKAIGCDNPYYLPLAVDPGVHRPLQLTTSEQEEFGSDLSHVGAGYHNRRQFFSGLLDFDFKIWGSEWDNPGPLSHVVQRHGERISTEDSVKIFNATRININLHSSTYHEGVNPFGDFLNPRTFEIACCGAFQLVDERRYLSENFDVGSEIISFANSNEFREKASHYLEQPEEREEIAAAARQRVLARHTYDHRLLEMLGVIAGRSPDWEPCAGGLPTAEEIIHQAGSESDLAGVMQRFVGRGPLTLEDVASEIEGSGGELSRTEAMILLLNEFRRWGLEKGVM